ncbi:GIY-YIG nuclease superfamily protein [Vibrio phage 1.187.O._10N.286.49.F1]|nr:GIY-YIG nuclease superfamily protein [Vibrio phage 1.187.O._10N.286.49.F1]
MEINFIDVTGIFKRGSSAEELLESANKYLTDCNSGSVRYDIICSLYLNRRRLQLSNNNLIEFITKFLPKLFTVYLLKSKGEIVYVGSSYSLETRLVAHKRDKSFDEVLVCIKSTKEEMLNLENAYIQQYTPCYNKSANLKRAASYGGDIFQEVFISLSEFLLELPVRKGCTGSLYDLMRGNLFKYSYDKLMPSGKSKIQRYYIQHNNSVSRSFNKKVSKLSTDKQYMVVTKPILDLLEDASLGGYIVKDSPTWNVNCFDNAFVFTHNKFRLVGNAQWYNSDVETMLSVFKEHIENKYGKDSVKRDKVFSFGKYKGLKVSEVRLKDVEYLSWCMENLPDDKLLELSLLDFKDSTPVFETALERLGRPPRKYR